jgi:hypothetical protein
MIYKGNVKIQDTGAYGIYHGSTPIRKVYHGSELEYIYSPYSPDDVLINFSESKTVTQALPQGKYYIEIVGSGGVDAYGQEGYWARRRGGASGARFSATIDVTNDNHMITLKCGASYGASSTLTIDDTLVATAGGGGNYTSIGTVTIGSTSITNISFVETESVNGKAGEETFIYGGGGSPSGGATVSTLGNYGHGQSNNPTGQYTNGLIYLKFVEAV